MSRAAGYPGMPSAALNGADDGFGHRVGRQRADA